MKIKPSAALAATALAFAAGCGTNGGGADPAPDIATSSEAIVGGDVDTTTTGAVGLAISFDSHQFFGHCSGTLIAPNLVLTARHCVSLLTGSTDDTVECGVTQFSPPGNGSWFLASPDTVRPTDPNDPGFFRSMQVRVPDGTQDFCGQDVALLILAANMPETMATPVVPRIDSPPATGEAFTAVGFGLTEPNTTDTDGTRMRGTGDTVRCIGLDCQTRGDSVHSSEWLSEDARTCPGDSGGPALDLQGRVMGVTSRGPMGCLSTVYGNVSSWKDFIISTAMDAAARGGYDPPFWTSGSSTPAAAEPDAGTSLAGASILGKECSGSCSSGYVCYADDGTPPGQCVPRCSRNSSTCPASYECATSINACVPKGSSVLKASGGGSSGGCSVGGRPSPANGGSFIALALGAALFARRRRASLI